MKFGKEFTSQMVPEWEEAYMDYNYLKTLLKELHKFKHKNKPPPHPNPNNKSQTPSGAFSRKLTLYRAFSGLTQRSSNSNNPPTGQDIESHPILVNPVHRDGTEGYETTFLMSADEGGEYELVYFKRLDDEFNKVVKFYKSKVGEVVKEAAVLNKQMDAFIAFRVKVENPVGWEWPERTVEMTRLASDVAASTANLHLSTPSGARSRKVKMEIIDEGESSREGKSDESGGDDEDEEDKEEKNETIPQNKQLKVNTPKNSSNVRKPAPLEVLDRVKINNTLETPRSTIKTVLKVANHTDLKFTRENLKKVENQLSKAFVEFYQKLRLLKSFGFLNTLAFSKIMKKYDKIASRTASKSYMKMVDNSYLGTSDEVTKLMERVEATFIKHFSNSNRTKGMSILRPKAKRERHRTTFSTGFLAGCTCSLILALIMIIRARKYVDKPGRAQYMRTMFPLYSLFGFIVLHMIMFAINIYYWRRYRVNYAFIFGFKQGTELGYKQVCLLSFGLGALALSCVLLNLNMEMHAVTKRFKSLPELLPLNLVLFVFVVLFLPLNVFYRSSRYFFLRCLYHCIAAPLYKVTLPDFFLADQLTSQVQAIRSLQFYICYYASGDYRTRDDSCTKKSVYKTFLFIVAVIPYMWRFLQCLRRLFEEKDPVQGYNGIKYFLTIVAVCLRTAYSLEKGSMTWKVLAGLVSAAAAIFATYWDFIHDWGVLNRNSKNKWLRDKLLVPHKSVYFIAIGLNVVFRFAWLQTVFDVDFSSIMHPQTLVAIVASLEIIRRGIWNFFRLENEHLNNVGKYRAFKSVPLPFNYDEEDKDE